MNDLIINDLISYRGYTPSMREILLNNLFRAELLKALKYPEISYRKFCKKEYMGKDRKQVLGEGVGYVKRHSPG